MNRQSLLLCCCLVVAHVGRYALPASDRSFLLDQSKPYVYLTVESIGPREPRNESEPKTGIFLQLHNNCIVPIVINTFGVPPGAHANEVGVLDHVVANPLATLGDGSVSYERADKMLGTQAESTALALQLTADQEAKPQSSPNATPTTSMPFGYLNPTSSFMTVKPGQAVLFSLPRDHVSATWHVEITFRFAAKNTSHFRAPCNFLAIYAEDLLTK
jgi:hypothetical protein